MKKQSLVYSLLFIQGITSLFFGFGLFFLLPHQFSEAIAHYVTLAPIVRNYYCFTLLVTGFGGLFFISSVLSTIKHHRPQRLLIALMGFCILYGFLIYPLVDLFYQTQSGLIYETVNIYRNALMHFSIYLSLHVSIAVFCAYCWWFAQPTKKHATVISATLAVVAILSGLIIYQKYYESQEVHLTENLKYQFVGVDGSGTIEVVSNVNAIQETFPSFFKTLTYEIVNNGKLSNGDEIAITVQYDKEVAKQLNLEVIDAVETVVVTGLREFYSSYDSIPSKIVEEARIVAKEYVQSKLLEVLPGKETQVSTVAEYYIMNQQQTMDSKHALAVLYRIAYVHEGKTYYYYRACHVENIHSDALKNLEILSPVLDQITYRSRLCETGVSDISEIEAKAHLNAMLLNSYDKVEEIVLISH